MTNDSSKTAVKDEWQSCFFENLKEIYGLSFKWIEKIASTGIL